MLLLLSIGSPGAGGVPGRTGTLGTVMTDFDAAMQRAGLLEAWPACVRGACASEGRCQLMPLVAARDVAACFALGHSPQSYRQQ